MKENICNSFSVLFTLFLLQFLFSSCSTNQDIEHSKAEIRLLNEKIGEIYRDNSFEKAMQSVDSVVQNGNLESKALTIYVRNVIKANLTNNRKGMVSEAFIYADSTLNAIATLKEDYPKQYFLALVLKGNSLINIGNYYEGLDYYDQARQFSRKALSDCYDSEFEEEVGYLLYSQHHYLDAIFYFKETLKRRELCTMDKNLQFYFFQKLNNNIGLSYQKLNELDSAKYYFERALSSITNPRYVGIVDSSFIEVAKGVVNGNLGQVYFEKGNFSVAESLYITSIDINISRRKNYLDALLTKIKLANLYIETGKLTKAKELIDIVSLESKITEIPEYNLRLSKINWKYYDKLNDFEKAYKAHLNYFKQHEVLRSRLTKWNTVDIKQNFILNERSSNLKQLQETNSIKNTILGSVLIGVVLLLIIIWQYVKQLNFEKQNSLKLETANTKLNQSYKDLEISIEQNAHFLKVVAHDLRNPISGIVGFSDLLKSDLPKNDILKIATIIGKTSSDALQIIEDLLFNQSLETSKTLERIDLKDLIQYSVSVAKFKADEKQITLNVELDVFEAEVLIHRDSIWRVLNNLIDNAIKFSHSNASVEIILSRNNDEVQVSVKDFGIGIPEELKELLFENNPIKMRSGTSGEESNGLGLILCKKLVEESNGKLWFESEIGQGSTFCASFPIV
ncbi:MAG: sensor histidine kinase [Bacteroidetes bacterium]|nr:sensor histidine kinase [Bacteroidota bacterium]